MSWVSALFSSFAPSRSPSLPYTFQSLYCYTNIIYFYLSLSYCSSAETPSHTFNDNKIKLTLDLIIVCFEFILIAQKKPLTTKVSLNTLVFEFFYL